MPTEEVLGGLVGRRVAGAHPLVDLEERLALRLDRVLAERGDERLADRLPFGEDRLDRGRGFALELRGEVLGDVGAGLEEDSPLVRSTTSAAKSARPIFAGPR